MSDYISREAMSETPKCPYCGDKMILHILPHRYHATLTSAWYQCVTCDSASPHIEFPLSCATSKIEETTLAVTLRRAEPENRVLTFDEVATYADLPEMTLMWVEVKFAKESDIFQEIPIGFNGELVQFLYPNGAQIYTDKHNYPPEDYGSRWRCWLKKPTAAEMEGTPWESS